MKTCKKKEKVKGKKNHICMFPKLQLFKYSLVCQFVIRNWTAFFFWLMNASGG